MTQVVDRLAELTCFRDRDMLDVSLAGALRELLLPLQVAIHRCVGDEKDRRWLTRARLGRDDAMAWTEPLWSEFLALPALAAFPLRMQALRLQQVVVSTGSPHQAIFPLVSEVEALGVLEIETEQALDADAYRQIDSILRVFRNFQALLDYSERDTLTGLLNRKTFDDAFNKLAGAGMAGDASQPQPGGPALPGAAPAESRSLPQARPHFIGVIDIDHFKRVNDNHGHLIGDEVLLLLSRLMRSVFRHHDRLYRFGGEEFVVLMRCANDVEARIAMERLRSSINAFAFPQVGALSVSSGYTQVQPGDTPSLAFDRADRAVYWAKNHGRDQVCSFAELVASGELAGDSKVGDVELF